MPILRAPDRAAFPLVAAGQYVATIVNITHEDFREKEDRFGKKGHIALCLRWQLEGMETEEGAPVELLQTVKLVTGDFIAKQGTRIGRLPWLTEITRALLIPDLQAGQDFDYETWFGKKAVLSIHLDRTADGARNHIDAVDKIGAEHKGPRVLQPPKATQPDEGDIPF
jgi:hypothetical protein